MHWEMFVVCIIPHLFPDQQHRQNVGLRHTALGQFLQDVFAPFNPRCLQCAVHDLNVHRFHFGKTLTADNVEGQGFLTAKTQRHKKNSFVFHAFSRG